MSLIMNEFKNQIKNSTNSITKNQMKNMSNMSNMKNMSNSITKKFLITFHNTDTDTDNTSYKLGDNIYTVNENGRVIYSSDTKNWIITNIQIQEWINFSSSSNGKYILCASDTGTYFSSTSGSTFVILTIPFLNVGMDVTGQYQYGVNDDIYISSDFGVTWKKLQIKINANIISVSDTGQYILVGTKDGVVYISLDYGLHFTSVKEIPVGIIENLFILFVDTVDKVNSVNYYDPSQSENINYYLFRIIIINQGIYESYINLNNLEWRMVSGYTEVDYTITNETITSSPIITEVSSTPLLEPVSPVPVVSPPVSPVPVVSPPVSPIPVVSPEPEPLPFPATVKTSQMQVKNSNLDNTIPVPEKTYKDQPYYIQIHNSTENLNVLKLDNYGVTVSTNGYVIINKNIRNGPIWTNTNIQIKKWIFLAGSYNGSYISFASDVGSYTSTDFGVTWNLLSYKFISIGIDYTGQFQVGIEPNKLYLSNNGSKTWSQYSSPDDIYNIICLSRDATKIILSGSLYTYLFSNGKFTKLNLPSGTIIEITIKKLPDVYLYDITINGRGIYRSRDGVLWDLLQKIK